MRFSSLFWMNWIFFNGKLVAVTMFFLGRVTLSDDLELLFEDPEVLVDNVELSFGFTGVK